MHSRQPVNLVFPWRKFAGVRRRKGVIGVDFATDICGCRWHPPQARCLRPFRHCCKTYRFWHLPSNAGKPVLDLASGRLPLPLLFDNVHPLQDALHFRDSRAAPISGGQMRIQVLNSISDTLP